MIRVGCWLLRDAAQSFGAIELDAEATSVLARKRLGKTLFHAAFRTDFYWRRLQQGGIEWADPILRQDPYRALAAIRPVSKHELRRAGAGVLAGGKVQAGWESSRSSGSTGEPFRVYYNPRAWATLKYLVKLRARYACGVHPTDRVAILDASPIRRPSSFGRSLRYTRISVLQPSSHVAEHLTAFAPDVLYGLPSALIEAAGAMRQRGDRLRVNAVFTSGELLSQTTRAQLAGAFQAPVRDIYGTSETKEIGWECLHGGMHLNADVVHLEVLDDAWRPVPTGEEGNLVVTSLVNRAMPLIRYITGDRGALRAGTCACGRSTPLLGVVTGRTSDSLVLRGGHRVSPYAFTCVLEGIAGVLRYQVRQLDSDRIRVRAIVDGGASREAIASEMRTAIQRQVASSLETEVEFVERFPTGPSVKFRVVEPLG